MNDTLSHRERALLALKGQQPDYIPTFELVFEETERDFHGRTFYGRIRPPESGGLTEKAICEYNARLYLDIAKKFEHSIIYVRPFLWPYERHYRQVSEMIKILRDLSGDEFCIMAPGDPTFRVPADPMEFTMQMYDAPESLKQKAQRSVNELIPIYEIMIKADADGFVFTSDYALNNGTFLAPEQFADFITPYLSCAVKEVHSLGGVVIKHSDGNLMKVMDQLVEAGIDALHSIDPMAGMDIKYIKEKYGSKICLCGNVHCAWLQTGTPEQIRSSTEYCLKYAKPDGGYIFSTSNCVFRGMPLKSYDLIHNIWKERKCY